MRKIGLAIFILAFSGGLGACNKGSQEGKPSDSKPSTSPAPAPQASEPATPPAPQASAPAVPAAPTAPAQAPAPAAAPVSLSAKMDFALPLQPISDPPIDFSAYRGKPVLLFYFGPTCPHCQAALPEVQAFGDEIRARGVQTLAIATSRSNPEEIRGFIRDFQARIPVFWDSERKFGTAYDVKLLPTLYLVNADGGVHKVEHFSGKASLDSLRARI